MAGIIGSHLAVKSTRLKKCAVRYFAHCVALFFLLAELASAAPMLDLYSESVFLGREGVLANSLRLRTEDPGVIAPYLTAGSETASQGQHVYIADPSSHFYAGGGLRLRSRQFSLRGEARARLPFLDRPNFTIPDFRVLGVFGDNFYISALSFVNFQYFAEPYSEALFTTADRSNVILTNYVRTGFRYAISPQWRADLFIEPFLILDTEGHYYNNRLDLKPSARVGMSAGPFLGQLIVSYVFNTYFSHASAETNPYLGKGSSGARVLVVLGALL